MMAWPVENEVCRLILQIKRRWQSSKRILGARDWAEYDEKRIRKYAKRLERLLGIKVYVDVNIAEERPALVILTVSGVVVLEYSEQLWVYFSERPHGRGRARIATEFVEWQYKSGAWVRNETDKYRCS